MSAPQGSLGSGEIFEDAFTRGPEHPVVAPVTWWEAMPTSVRTSLVVSAWLFLVSVGTGVVMGLWLLYVLAKAL